MARNFEDTATCVQIVERRCVRNEATQTGLGDYDLCFEQIEEAECSIFLQPDTRACRRVPGAAAAGEPCRYGVECASDGCRYTGNICGACAAPLGEGDPCVGVTDAACGRDLYCDVAADACAPVRVVGEGQPCGDGSRCELFHECKVNTTSTCEPDGRAQDGEACTTNDDCAPRLALACGTDDTCGPLEILVGKGESCGTEGAFPRCSETYYCHPDDAICVRRKQAGEACGPDLVAGSDCDVDLACEDGVCVTYAELCLD
jgi:hypothetical protein